MPPDFKLEESCRANGLVCAGVDEVGRGCLAGPVVAAAVVLPERIEGEWWWELDDSKKLSPKQRSRLSALVWENARAVGVGFCSVEEIDQINILRAALLAMRRAVAELKVSAGVLLVDGNMNPFSPRYGAGPGEDRRQGVSRVETVIKGDQKSISIAAASVVAKVYRDEWMARLGAEFPGYGLELHKGYSTPAHYAALAKLGPHPSLHRKSFAPIREMMLARTDLARGSEHGKETLPS